MRKIWQAIRQRGRFENDMNEEMRFHLEAAASDLESAGHSKSEALRRARLAMGAAENYKEQCRQARGLRWLDELRLDLLYAIRGLRRDRAFATVAVLALTLGIGANASIFALVNSVVLKTLPVQRPEELQLIYWTLQDGQRTFHRSSNGSSTREGSLRVADMFAYPHFVNLRKDLSHGADLFAHSSVGRVSVTVAGQAQLARGLATSWNYFQALGVEAHAGRTFLPEDEDVKSHGPVALLGYDYWTRAFGGNKDVLGQSLLIGDTKVAVVGILPAGFHGVSPGDRLDVALPLTVWDQMTQGKRSDAPRSWWVQMMARLKPGYAAGQLRSETETRLRALLSSEGISDQYAEPGIRVVDGSRGLQWLRRDFEKPLGLVMLAAVVILLMAAGNVGGLMLARTEARVAETGARLALGASRERLARQHLTESLLLALLGLTGGLLLAMLLGDALPWLLSRGGEAPVIDLAPDMRFIWVAIGSTLAVALFFGLFPALRSSRLDLTTALKRSHGARSGRLPMGRILVGAQVGLSLVLLIMAGMFLRTVANLRSLQLGFVPEQLLVFRADGSLAGYRGPQLAAYYDRAVEKLSETSGVRSVSLTRHILLQGGASSALFSYRDAAGNLKSIEHQVHSAGPRYFETLGIPLLAGRDISVLDTLTSKRVVLVNQKLARLMRPDGGSPVGQSLYGGEKAQDPYEIVGVVGDAKYNSLRKEAPLTIYAPFSQRSIRDATFYVKTAGDPLRMAAAVRQAMSEVDPKIPIYDLRTQEEQISVAMERERVLAWLLVGFGALALTLALAGIYGVLAYSVTRRTSEIGIRTALGAAPRVVRGMIVRESLLPVIVGLASGLFAAWWLTALLDTFVFGVKPMDPWSIAGAIMVLGAGAALAAWIPAQRASRVSPLMALRYE